MKNQHGFTFVEILVVFSIFLVIASFTVIFIQPHYTVFERERFFSQFKADFLYSQQYAISRQKQLVISVKPKEQRYVVQERGGYDNLIDRTIPDSITVQQGNLGKGSFFIYISPNGGVNQFGSFYFLVDGQRYRVTLQIGVGRLYVVEDPES